MEVAMTILSIPDMTCAHCEASVIAALRPLAEEVHVDLAARTAELTAPAPSDQLIAALDRIGFPARIIS
jgi:copper chaperone